MERSEFRSNLEYKWHLQLEDLGMEHQYERMKIPLIVNGKKTTYTPDFYIMDQELVIEVKGTHKWEGISMQKTRELAKSGYTVIKCVDEGKFNFINNEGDECLIVKCNSCSKTFFTPHHNATCPYCREDGENQILHYGNLGIFDWYRHEIHDEWLFDQTAFNQINNTMEDKIKEQHTTVFEKLAGKPRKLVFDVFMIKKLEELFIRYPNMQDIKKFVFNIIETLPVRNDSVISFPPILLEGSAGCGKTSFATEFAQIITRNHFRKIELSNDIAGFAITGTERGFNSREVGIILQSMFSDGFAPLLNPVVILDEIDKIYHHTHSAENVFHTLLERKSAEIFTDNFFGIPVNASKVNYIGLCNSTSTISRPILDRFKLFQIRDYYKDEIIDLVIPNIYKDWIKRDNIAKDRVPDKLSLEIREEIYSISESKPRKIIPVLNDLLKKYLYLDSDTQDYISLFTRNQRKNWRSLISQETYTNDSYYSILKPKKENTTALLHSIFDGI